MAIQKPNTNTVSYWLTHADDDEEKSSKTHATSVEEEDSPEENTLSYWLCKANISEEKAGEVGPDKLTFHPVAHSRVDFSDDLRTAKATCGYNECSWVFTSRELLSDEWFTIIVDSCYCDIRIGVSKEAPSMDILPTEWCMKVQGCSLTLIKDCVAVGEYGTYPHAPTVGYRYSVIRKRNGDVHYAVNGKDYGVAFRNVPDNVDGIVQFHWGAKFTID